MKKINFPITLKGSIVSDFYKRCTLCGKEWYDKEAFILDKNLHFNGHQINFQKLAESIPQKGLLIFTHKILGCGTSLAVPAEDYRDF